jgi:hypothetical protein
MADPTIVLSGIVPHSIWVARSGNHPFLHQESVGVIAVRLIGTLTRESGRWPAPGAT